jgi:Mg-chelatase subunit ChlD
MVCKTTLAKIPLFSILAFILIFSIASAVEDYGEGVPGDPEPGGGGAPAIPAPTYWTPEDKICIYTTYTDFFEFFEPGWMLIGEPSKTLVIGGGMSDSSTKIIVPLEFDVYSASLDITGQSIEEEPALDVVMVNDISGSMNGSLEDMQADTKDFIDLLLAHTYNKAGLVSFETEVGFWTLPFLTNDKDTLYYVIDQYEIGDRTCIACGIAKGIELLKDRGTPVKAMVLMTNANTNRCTYGVCTPEMAKKQAVNKAKEAWYYGIKIYPIPYNPETDTTTLEKIANVSHGKLYDYGTPMSDVYSDIEEYFSGSPSDVMLDIGDDENEEFSHSGEFLGTETVEFTSSLEDLLACECPGRELVASDSACMIDLKVSSATTGVIVLNNLLIEGCYNTSVCGYGQILIQSASYDSETGKVTLNIFNTGDVLLTGFNFALYYPEDVRISFGLEYVVIAPQDMESVTFLAEESLEKIVVQSIECPGVQDMIFCEDIKGLPCYVDEECEGVTCEDHCVGSDWYYDGYCEGGECVYEIEYESEMCMYTDNDGDGYTSDVDCDDNDPNTYPGAEEACGDGKDNDCDGEADEGCSTGGGGYRRGGGISYYCGDGFVTGDEECEADADCPIFYSCENCACLLGCVEDWSCSDWSDCSQEGIQTRTCTDSNDCGTELIKPSESKYCEYTEGEEAEITPLTEVCGNDVCEENEDCENCPEDCGPCVTEGGLTGLFTGLQAGAVAGLVALLVILLLLFFSMKNKKK